MDSLRATDAILFGNNRFEEWVARFEAEWNAPDMMMVDIAWRNLPEAVRASIAAVAPPELIEALEGGKHGIANPGMDAKRNQRGDLDLDVDVERTTASGAGLRPSPKYTARD